MLDSKDRSILRMLQVDARLSLTTVAKQLGLATSTIHERVRKMEARGDVLGFYTWINPRAVGLNILAFIQVLVVGVENEVPFIKLITRLPEVEACYDLTGEWSYLLKVRTRDIEALSKFRRDHINPAAGVARTNTSIAMTHFKETRTLNLE
ncbi:MAG: Lrp/AsnC family transcriptional regulator [Candidatus Marinimicrobia bacterium]|nr:Lrp/AsnC family transcriptional regulator [Candidatus Neomarinimicrobiota bacterium]